MLIAMTIHCFLVRFTAYFRHQQTDSLTAKMFVTLGPFPFSLSCTLTSVVVYVRDAFIAHFIEHKLCKCIARPKMLRKEVEGYLLLQSKRFDCACIGLSNFVDVRAHCNKTSNSSNSSSSAVTAAATATAVTAAAQHHQPHITKHKEPTFR